ncbi:conserved Plasmodium protein, unknown function [Plasmodium ovale wallikeri]|uniref:Uncharacterized protein n=1 Tax=Plasmodium ovale wallikeri TaxID=864142 RepID=A0A1A8YMM4_PLAOA|nr:conserved Plasmodium protein, unknown function [Plasmodium ovale wallikeri]SBT46166.1 conserved Plasmodium protein, unknown function [Plasmodium ovale wallikeri]
MKECLNAFHSVIKCIAKAIPMAFPWYMCHQLLLPLTSYVHFPFCRYQLLKSKQNPTKDNFYLELDRVLSMRKKGKKFKNSCIQTDVTFYNPFFLKWDSYFEDCGDIIKVSSDGEMELLRKKRIKKSLSHIRLEDCFQEKRNDIINNVKNEGKRNKKLDLDKKYPSITRTNSTNPFRVPKHLVYKDELIYSLYTDNDIIFIKEVTERFPGYRWERNKVKHKAEDKVVKVITTSGDNLPCGGDKKGRTTFNHLERFNSVPHINRRSCSEVANTKEGNNVLYDEGLCAKHETASQKGNIFHCGQSTQSGWVSQPGKTNTDCDYIKIDNNSTKDVSLDEYSMLNDTVDQTVDLQTCYSTIFNRMGKNAKRFSIEGDIVHGNVTEGMQNGCQGGRSLLEEGKDESKCGSSHYFSNGNKMPFHGQNGKHFKTCSCENTRCNGFFIQQNENYGTDLCSQGSKNHKRGELKREAFAGISTRRQQKGSNSMGSPVGTKDESYINVLKNCRRSNGADVTRKKIDQNKIGTKVSSNSSKNLHTDVSISKFTKNSRRISPFKKSSINGFALACKKKKESNYNWVKHFANKKLHNPAWRKSNKGEEGVCNWEFSNHANVSLHTALYFNRHFPQPRSGKRREKNQKGVVGNIAASINCSAKGESVSENEKAQYYSEADAHFPNINETETLNEFNVSFTDVERSTEEIRKISIDHKKKAFLFYM